MKSKRLGKLIDESIRMELNAAKLYLVFEAVLPEDEDLWRQLASEEKNHAELLRGIRESFVKSVEFPSALLSDSIELLCINNTRTEALIEKFEAIPPTRVEACEAALALEQDVGESAYTQFITETNDSQADSVFQILNKSDQIHEQRIRQHLDSLLTEFV